MKPNTITKPNGKTRPLKNLRPIMDLGRRAGVREVTITEKPKGKAELTVSFFDGTIACIDFESFRVCVDFVHGRRSWGITPIIINL